MKVRFEPWGAWVRLEEPPALVALDREGVRALGLEGGRAWNPGNRPSAPLEVHLAITSRCGAGCDGCYLDAQPEGTAPDSGQIVRTLDALALAGVFTVAFGGGEPTTRDDLGQLARAARERGLVPVLTTSGLGLSERRAESLRDFAQVNVSYDGPGASYRGVRGFDGASAAERAIETLVRKGVRVGVNVVLTRSTFDDLEQTLARARSLGAVEAQLLRYKPVGRARSVTYADRRLTPFQCESLGPVLRRLTTTFGARLGIRIDCALVCFLSADEAIGREPDQLVRWGIFGCEAGNALAAVDVHGRVAPCSFAEASDLPSDELLEGYAEDPLLSMFRDASMSFPEPCASCFLRDVCKGGCKVVAAAAGCFGPDPECPRVIRHGSRPS